MTAAVKTEEVVDRKGVKTTRPKWEVKATGSAKLRGVESVIKAGPRLYAATADGVCAVELPLPAGAGGPPAVSWRAAVGGKPANLLAADGRLFVVTLDGHIHCFGPGQVEPIVHDLPPAPAAGASSEFARAAVEATGVREGYAVVWGVGSGRLVADLVRLTNLHLIVVEPDAAKVEAARRELQAAGLYGDRVAVHRGDPHTFSLPPYLASLMVSEDPVLAGVPLDATGLKKFFEPLRPYGGVAYLGVPAARRAEFDRQVAAAALAGAKVREAGGGVLLSREGALPGAGNWTHEHADAANTRVSPDRLARAPLGVLWFGGPSHDGILPRHGHGPQPQVIDGRLIIEGVDMLRCMDIYTGRVLWEAKLPGVGAFYDNTAHQPGANAAGTNFVSTSDGIYVLHDRACLRLDPATGQEIARFRFPAADGEPAPEWGYLNVAGDYLVGGTGPEEGLPDVKGRPSQASRSSSRRLAVMDRHTGAVLWTATARDGFRHNTVCVGGGRVYAVDRVSGETLARLKRRGEAPKQPPRLVAFDLTTGREVWYTTKDVFGTWLSYSAAHDVLVEAGRVARDTLTDEPKGMRAYKAGTGSVLWDRPDYVGPAMIRGDQVLKDRSACHLLTGEPYRVPDPLTGVLAEWTWTRTYGCNTPAASECLLTFRSGAAGYYDLETLGGTGNFGGFRSSCTNNLIVAGGLINAPDYTRTCTCSYQNQTSLALVHMPDVEVWTYTAMKKPDGPVRRLGLNLGAPGDRRAEGGTLWLEYPTVGGQSPRVDVAHTPQQVEWFRRHPTQVEGSLNWVAASGAEGLESLTVTLGGGGDPERAYTVRLHFLEPGGLGPGKRVFHVAMQGRRVLENLDVSQEAGGPARGLVKEFKGVKVSRDLTLTLTPADPSGARPVLSGVEVVAEGW
jgi:outer membrane protein assembly factor BamB